LGCDPWEDSNRDIPILQKPFEKSREFQSISRKSGLETFGKHGSPGDSQIAFSN
jgi:hypothetical protein